MNRSEKEGYEITIINGHICIVNCMYTHSQAYLVQADTTVH